MEILTDFVNNVLGGNSSNNTVNQSTAAKPKTNPFASPTEEIKTDTSDEAREYYRSKNYDDATIDRIFKLSPEAREKFDVALIKQTGVGNVGVLRSQLKKRGIDPSGLGERQMQSLLRTMIQRESKKSGISGSSSTGIPDRDALIKQLPSHVQQMAGTLSDSALNQLASTIAKKQLDNPNGIGYNNVKGQSVKIVQDEAFKRAGYKSGDTVCIRIP